MGLASKLTLVACGIYFLVGLLTGVWRYLATRRNPKSEAPRYVNVAHSASLQYAFASLVLLQLLQLSPYPEIVNLAAAGVPLFFFGASIISYLIHAALRDTDNQFRQPHALGRLRISPPLFHSFVWLLIVGEVGGFVVLFVGALRTLFGAGR